MPITKKKARAAAAGAGKATGTGTSVSPQAATAGLPNLGAVMTLPDFLATAGQLTLDDQKLIVSQALLLLQELYVHLPLKRAMYAIEPIQRLRLLERQLDSASGALKERKFHNEMIAIFTGLRDLHTNYILPAPFRSHVAFLPFELEEFYDDQNSESCHYVVSKVTNGFNQPPFGPGVIVTHWNGIPIDRAVELNADRNAGSNPDARHARGLENMTLRPMALNFPPDEEWVTVGFTTNGQSSEVRIPWTVYKPDMPNASGTGSAAARKTARALGVDLQAEILRRVKVDLFVPQVAQQRRTMRSAPRTANLRARAAAADIDPAATSVMPDVFKFGPVTTPTGSFGYLRIFSFMPPENTTFEDFINEAMRIIGLLPKEGLIIDVRGNGGGVIMAGERLLQLFTPRPIQTERLHFINSALTLRLTELFDDLAVWKDSIAQSVEMATTFSQGFPIEPDENANALGQRYQGPVVLITDARCYSTTDIFSAGFQDHQIGPILGASGNTGAGGANVWEHDLLVEVLPDTFKPLPRQTSMRLAVRRTTRVGKMSGVPVEDLGVVPDARHKMTRKDVFEGNTDLIAAAGALLKQKRARALSGVLSTTAGTRRIAITSKNIDRVDVFLNSRPALSVDVAGPATNVELPVPPAQLKRVTLEGYDGGELVVRAEVPV